MGLLLFYFKFNEFSNEHRFCWASLTHHGLVLVVALISSNKVKEPAALRRECLLHFYAELKYDIQTHNKFFIYTITHDSYYALQMMKH